MVKSVPTKSLSIVPGQPTKLMGATIYLPMQTMAPAHLISATPMYLQVSETNLWMASAM